MIKITRLSRYWKPHVNATGLKEAWSITRWVDVVETCHALADPGGLVLLLSSGLFSFEADQMSSVRWIVKLMRRLISK